MTAARPLHRLRLVPLPRFAGEDMQRRRLEILPCREAAGEGDRPKDGGGGRVRTYGASRRARIHAIASSSEKTVGASGAGGRRTMTTSIPSSRAASILA